MTRRTEWSPKHGICGTINTGTSGVSTSVRDATGRISSFLGVPNMAVTIADPQEQLADALRFSRQQKHHPNCRCNTWRDTDGSGYCTPMHATWNKAVNRCLDRVMGKLV